LAFEIFEFSAYIKKVRPLNLLLRSTVILMASSINSTILVKSDSINPLVVIAGEPRRIPYGIKADLSPGIVFLFVAILINSNILSTLAPSIFLLIQNCLVAKI
jgi:hypothetical protein